MDASQRCENMPTEELQSFEAYLERVKTQVAGQGIIQEIAGMPTPSMAQLLHSQPQRSSQLGRDGGSIGQNYPAQLLQDHPPNDNHLGSSGEATTGLKYPGQLLQDQPPRESHLGGPDESVTGQKHPAAPLYGEGLDTYTVPPPPPLSHPPGQQYQQAGQQGDSRQPGFRAFMEGMVGGSGSYGVAASQPYGVVAGTSHLLTGAGGVTGQLAGLHLTDKKEVSSVWLQGLYWCLLLLLRVYVFRRT